MYKESSREKRASKLTRRGTRAMKANRVIENALKNDEVRLVLEIATRAREIESREQPRDIITSTETAAVLPNQASLEMLCWTQTA
jgi:hypothetical protein